MKKYLLILFSIISFCSCGSEDETIDISVLPDVTSTGANTFGCLVDGWVYVGGRYRGWNYSDPWTHDSFVYYKEIERPEGNDGSESTESGVVTISTEHPEQSEVSYILNVSVSVKPAINVSFKIQNPQEGKESAITSVKFDGEELQDGTATITRFDTKRKIISGTFGNGERLTNGRFDVQYATNEDDE